MRSDDARVTHVVKITGGDRPGLVAGMSEVLVKYNVNIVRMNSHRISTGAGTEYKTSFAVSIPKQERDAVEAALYNTAGSLRLDLLVEAL